MCTYFKNQIHKVGLEVKQQLASSSNGGDRMIIAVAGAPASGKSTFAEELVGYFNTGDTDIAALLPMDGYHLDNRILERRDLLPRKGAPQTFDALGFCKLVGRLKDTTADIFHPVFDRPLDMAIAGAGVIKKTHKVVVVEGNYLLLKTEPWSAIHSLFDKTIFIDVPTDELERRLIVRWIDHGLETKMAKARALKNDIPNAVYVLNNSIKGNIVIDANAVN